MANVESLSHKHLVVLESTGTALQPRTDQEPSNDELRSGERTDQTLASQSRGFPSSTARSTRRDAPQPERERTPPKHG